MGQEHSALIDDATPPETLSERSLDAVADFIKAGKARRIVVLTGAGISTAAGIPDFRSPDTGLYANLAALDLPEPEAVFDLSFFRTNPRPFYALAKDLYPGARYRPTVSHVFIALLARKGLLHMLFTQNIDCLEREAGIPADRIIEAHGSFAAQRCIECKREFDGEKMRASVARGEVPRCEGPAAPRDGDGHGPGDGGEGDKGGAGPRCGGLVKPDIVFFGESLPSDFFSAIPRVSEADLVLVMGTSLQVRPFANLPSMAAEGVPRVLFNLERVGDFGTRADDVLALGDCDSGVRRLAAALGWREELEAAWRALVGGDEADRQLRSKARRDAVLQEGVEKLAEDVEEVLREEKEEEAAEAADAAVAKLADEVEKTLHVDDRGKDGPTPAADDGGGAPKGKQEPKPAASEAEK
ncbi:hypothetical protein VTJ83DRAFT_3698 [Remersonia thermophila]|uniref:NAD-dependent protein deacetylase n=1 Tax=Remersonia thermophila TaxID=72144 RepID=A0ABR4DET2_9PEZI